MKKYKEINKVLSQNKNGLDEHIKYEIEEFKESIIIVLKEVLADTHLDVSENILNKTGILDKFYNKIV